MDLLMDRLRVLVVFSDQYRSYREAIANALTALRPHAEVAVARPAEFARQVRSLDPHLVISSEPALDRQAERMAWVELSADSGKAAEIRVGARRSTCESLGIEEMLCLLDETEKLLSINNSRIAR